MSSATARGSLGAQRLRDETGGSVYLRLSTRPSRSPSATCMRSSRIEIVEGAYWLREPGPNAEIVVAYTGAVAPEAIEAVGLMAEDRRDVGLLAVTSADRLNAGWTAAQRARERGRCRRGAMLSGCSPGCRPIAASSRCSTATRRRSAGSARSQGTACAALGVERFGQTGTVADLYRHYGLDARAIVAAALGLAPERPIRHLRAASA